MAIELLNIDCMEYMEGLPEKAFDLAIVDPPYGLGDRKRSVQGAGKLKNIILNKDCIHRWDKAPSYNYFQELFRISKNQIIWGGNHFSLPPTRGIICWDKYQVWPNFAAWEMAWTNFNVPAKIFRLGNRTTGKIHPTQKPVALYKWLLNNYAEPGQQIFDSHMGSGSSAIAAHYFGCDFVGCEIDEDYYKAALKRFKAETAQQTMWTGV